MDANGFTDWLFKAGKRMKKSKDRSGLANGLPFQCNFRTGKQEASYNPILNISSGKIKGIFCTVFSLVGLNDTVLNCSGN
jgi:hypothetical protein